MHPANETYTIACEIATISGGMLIPVVDPA